MTDVPLKGMVTVEIDGRPYTLLFDWDALAQVDAEVGSEGFDLLNPETLAKVAAAGFRARHPEMTADMIKRLRPPLMPMVDAVSRAYRYAYYGDQIPPAPSEDSSKKKTSLLKAGWRRLSEALSRPA